MRGRKSASRLLRAAAAGRDLQLRAGSCARSRALLQRRQPRSDASAGGAASARHAWRDRIGLDVERLQLLQPRVLVRREHGVRRAGLGQHLAALEDRRGPCWCAAPRRMGPRVRRAPRRRASSANGSSSWFAYTACTPSVRQRARRSRSTPGRGAPAAGRPEGRAGRPVEFNGPGSSWMNSTRRSRRGSGSRMSRVEHEHAPDLRGGAQRVVERGMVVGAQVAATIHGVRPDQCFLRLQSPLHPAESASG